MEYEFEINNEKLTVETDNNSLPGTIKTTVNGLSIESEIMRISDNYLILNIDGRNHKAFIANDGSRVYMHLDGQILTFDRTDNERKTYSGDALEFGAKDRVVTPMPGRVVKILVEVGESVKTRQPLVIVESMKMENEIKSPSDGVIKSINFQAGDLVGTGQPIILLEPTEN